MNQRGLIALKASTTLDASQELPNRLLFLPWGDSDTRFGKIKVNDITLAAVPSNQRKAKFDHVAIDFSHNSVPGTPYFTGEPVKLAARKAAVEVVKGEGIYLSAPEWIIDRDMARNFTDLSLCVKTDEAGNVIFVHSGALCRQGEVDGITFPLAADPFATQPTPATPKPGDGRNPTKDNTMDFRNLWITYLGLADTATDDDIKAAVAKLGEKQTACLNAAITEALKPLTAKIEALEASDIARERAAIEAQAVRDGKVIPLSALPGKDGKGGMEIAALRSLVAELPVTVPMEKRTPEGVKTLAASARLPEAGSASEIIRRQLGITEEAWNK
jgi:hypothetical protein